MKRIIEGLRKSTGGLLSLLMVFNSLAITLVPSAANATSVGPNNGTVFPNTGYTWTNPQNAAASDNSYATIAITSSSQTTPYHKSAGFGFNVPTDAIINGIEVNLERAQTTANCFYDESASIMKDGVTPILSSNRAVSNPKTYWPTTDTYKTYGGPTDLWNQTWTPAEINNSGFGFGIYARKLCSGSMRYARIDNVSIKVYYTLPDTTPPTISFPLNEVNPTLEATGPLTLFNFHPTVTDNIDPAPLLTSDTPAGSLFPLGATTVTWIATDAAGNTSTATQTITIKDTASPYLNPLSDITAEATSSAGAVVSFTPIATDIADPDPQVVCDPSSGSTFPLGVTSVECTATDSSGNASIGTFVVTVQDTTVPTISHVDDIVQEATSASSTPVAFIEPTATDLVDGVLPVVCSPSSGSMFTLGVVTTVNCSAIDSAGNSSSTSFTVTVQDTTAPSGGFNYPSDGDYLRGTVELSAWMSDFGSGLQKIEYWFASVGTKIGEIIVPSTETMMWDTTMASDGEHDLWATIFDNAGNSYNTPLVSVVVDNTIPEAPIISLPINESYYNTTPIRNEWSPVTDNSGIKEYRLEYQYDDGHTFSGAPYRTTVNTYRNHTPGTWEQGGVKFRVQAIDNAGNEGEWSNWVHYYYDITPPEAPNLVSPLDGAVQRGDSLISDWGPVNDAYKYEYQSCWDISCSNLKWSKIYNYGSPEFNNTAKEAANVPDGIFYWHVRTIDRAGNIGPWSDIWEITIDNTVPGAEIVSPSAGLVSGNVDVAVTATDSYGLDKVKLVAKNLDTDATIVLRNDKSGTVYSGDYFTTWETKDFDDGRYRLKLIVEDEAGNVSTDVEKVFIIDNTKPMLSISDPSSGDYKNNNFNVIGTATDLNGIDYVEVKIKNGSGDTVMSWSTATRNLDSYLKTIDISSFVGDGNYEVIVRAYDKAGNSKRLTTDIVIDRAAPVITLNGSNPVNLTVGSTYSEQGATTDDGSSVVIGGNVNAGSVGTYTLTYNATDIAGNSAVQVTRTVNVNPIPTSPSVPTATTGSTTVPLILGAVTSQEETDADGNTDTKVSPEGEILGATDELAQNVIEEDNNDDQNTESKGWFAQNWWWLLLILIGISGGYMYLKKKK